MNTIVESMINQKLEASPGMAVGLVAGEGKLPAILARAAKDKGYRVVGFALSEAAAHQLTDVVDKIYQIAPGQERNRAIEEHDI